MIHVGNLSNRSIIIALLVCPTMLRVYIVIILIERRVNNFNVLIAVGKQYFSRIELYSLRQSKTKYNATMTKIKKKKTTQKNPPPTTKENKNNIPPPLP